MLNKRTYILSHKDFMKNKINEDSKDNHLKSLKANNKFNLIDRDYKKIDDWKWNRDDILSYILNNKDYTDSKFELFYDDTKGNFRGTEYLGTSIILKAKNEEKTYFVMSNDGGGIHTAVKNSFYMLQVYDRDFVKDALRGTIEIGNEDYEEENDPYSENNSFLGKLDSFMDDPYAFSGEFQ